MEKMKMQSPDMTENNIEKIAALFPNCITESSDENGNLKKAINFDILKQMLSKDVTEGNESYEFTWVGKKAAIVEANKPIRKTLRPYKEESVNWDTTENLYIEGDNLEVLKLLQEGYLGKIKLIYIDPPYNTGNDFIYNDDFMMDSIEYDEESGAIDIDGNRMVKNTDSNGRFHSDWCSMIYSRLLLSRNLLSDDGTIFISIDDNEQGNLKKICDEIYGTANFVGTILWKKKTNGNNMGFLPPVHDYILVYAKKINCISDMGYPVSKEYIEKTYSNPDNDSRGPWTTSDLSANHKGPYFSIVNPINGEIHYPPKGRYWVFNEEEVKKRIEDGRIIFGKSGTGKPVQKVFLSSRKFSLVRAESWWDNKGMNSDATTELSDLFGEAKIFTHPKPSKLIYNILKIATEKNSIVLDFFSGSSSTVHGIYRLNEEDNGNRKFIMVQLPEKTDEDSEAFKSGYNNICEIGKERIRRAGRKIKEENPLTTTNLDTGFRVLKLDESNMTDVFYTPLEINQQMLIDQVENIKSDRSDLDLLFGCLIDWGIPLHLPYTSETIENCTVHNYNDGDLIACFDKKVPETVIKEIAKRQPLRAVFRDSSFENSPSKINVGEIFKMIAPDTRVKVI